MNKRIPPPAPVTPLFAPMCSVQPRFSRFVVLPTPDGQHVVTDTLFGLQVGNAHATSAAAEQAAQSWRSFAKQKAVLQ